MNAAGPDRTKAEWRSHLRSVRSGLDWDTISRRIVDSLAGFHRLATARIVLSFLPLAGEVDLGALSKRLPHTKWALTRTPDKGPLTVHLDGGPRERHPYGFEQPVAGTPEIPPDTVDVALVPGLGFDQYGTRLGHGAGYFDRLLAGMRPGAALVGIAPHAVVVDRLPVEPHDIEMTHLAHETGVHAAATHFVDLPEASQRLVIAARKLGLEPGVRLFPFGTKTAQDAADAIGCHLAAITKSMVFVAGDEPVVALIPGDRRLDPEKLRVVTGADTCARAPLDVVRSATGFAAGGTPPFGHASKLRLFADRRVRDHDPVWIAGGTPTTVFPIRVDDLLAITGAIETDLVAD